METTPAEVRVRIDTVQDATDFIAKLQQIKKAEEAAMLEAPAVAEPVEVPVSAEVRDISSAPSVREAQNAKDEVFRPSKLRALGAAALVAATAVVGIFGVGPSTKDAEALTQDQKDLKELNLLSSSGEVAVSYDDPTTTQVESFADRPVVFFAEQAPEGSNYFGPAGETANKEDAYKDMIARVSADPMLLVGLMEYAGLSEAMTTEQRDELINKYMNDQEAFEAAHTEFKDFLEQDGNKLSMSTMTEKYWTYYAVERSEQGLAPLLYQSQEEMEDELVLKIALGSPAAAGAASSLYFKISCGYQPVDIKEFEGVPKKGEHPDVPETTTSTTTSSTSTTSSVPETSTTTSSTSTTSSVPETSTTTSSTSTTSSVPETSTTTSSTSTTSSVPEATTTTTTIDKHDEGELPGEHNEPGEPDEPGDGPAEQEPNPDGYLPGETPVDTPEEVPSTTIPTTTQPPATTSPAPSSTNPPVSVTTVVPTTAPENQMPEMP